MNTPMTKRMIRRILAAAALIAILPALADLPSAAACPQNAAVIEVKVSKDAATHAIPAFTVCFGEEREGKLVTEYIYPTKYDVVVVETNGVYSAVVEPKAYTMREVGAIVKATPTFADGKINLALGVEVVDPPEWKDYGGTVTASDGTKSDFQMEQPTFKAQSVNRRLLLTPGETATFKSDGLTIAVVAQIPGSSI